MACVLIGSSVSLVSDYGLDDWGWIPDFSSSLCIRTGSGGPTSFPSDGYHGRLPGGKVRPGRDADHSPPSSTEFENENEL
jgi:hypothetical protein